MNVKLTEKKWSLSFDGMFFPLNGGCIATFSTQPEIYMQQNM